MNSLKSDSLFLAFAVVLSMLFVSGLGGASVMQILGYGGMPLAEVILRQELNAARALLAQQGLGSLAIFLVPALALQQRWARAEEPATPAVPRHEAWTWRETIGAWMLLPALLPALEWVSGWWFQVLQGQAWATSALAQAETQSEWVERMLFLPSWGDTILAVLVFVVVAAVGEELFFRGALQRMLRARTAPWVSVVASAALFAGFHFDLIHAPFLVVAGLVLAWMYERSGRLWVPLGAHVIHNGITYIQTQVEGPGSYAAIVQSDFSWMVVAGLAVAGALVAALARK
jgi:membrane protease YdiL (CAAX protease family)